MKDNNDNAKKNCDNQSSVEKLCNFETLFLEGITHCVLGPTHNQSCFLVRRFTLPFNLYILPSGSIFLISSTSYWRHGSTPEGNHDNFIVATGFLIEDD